MADQQHDSLQAGPESESAVEQAVPAQAELAPEEYTADLAHDHELGVAGSNGNLANLVSKPGQMPTGLNARAIARLQRQQGNFYVQRILKGTVSASPMAAQRSLKAAGEGDDWLAYRIEDASGAGQPVEPQARAQLAAGLHDDLTDVRVHADADAGQMAEALDAVAFTTGQDIFFAPGAYQPGTKEGLELLAHEAAHTAQQAAGPVAGTPAPGGVLLSDPADAFEQAAERTAHDVASAAESVALEPAGMGSTAGRTPIEAQVVQRAPGKADSDEDEKKRPSTQPVSNDDLAKLKKLEDESR